MHDTNIDIDFDWTGTETYPMVVTLRHADETCPYAYIRCERLTKDEKGVLTLYKEIWQGQDKPYLYEEIMKVTDYSSFLIQEIPIEE